ncbi:hypothetical protein [Devosia sp. XK-2]|uniref:hypothetical protein n=1 Tax=Devosia sp. XK-2 TaxID=3126689 RepID=UPI0030D0E273
MTVLAQLASLLGLELEEMLAKAKSNLLVYGLIVLFSAVASGFLIAAGYMALAERAGAIVAALILAGGFLALALAIYIGAFIASRRRQRKFAQRRRSAETGALLSSAALVALPLLSKSPTLVRWGLPAAAIAAFALLRDNEKED